MISVTLMCTYAEGSNAFPQCPQVAFKKMTGGVVVWWEGEGGYIGALERPKPAKSNHTFAALKKCEVGLNVS